MNRSTDFLHALATRVGIGVYDEEWFDYRLKLFEAITVPSVANQTSQDFTWLLVVDAKMPLQARERFDKAIAGLKNAVVLPVELKIDFRPTVVKWSKEKATALGLNSILTSRLDDDDALHTDSFERLESEARDFLKVSRHKYAVFSLALGCMWLPSHRRGYTRYHDSHSLGLSLMEPTDECESVYSRPHREIKQRYAPRGAYIRGIDGDTRWWLYTTHNIADSDQGDGKRREKILNHRYGYYIDDELLLSYGLDPASIAELGDVAEPNPQQPTKFLSLRAIDAERKIKALQESMKERRIRVPILTRRRLAARIKQLEAERRAVGSKIVER